MRKKIILAETVDLLSVYTISTVYGLDENLSKRTFPQFAIS